MPHSNTCNQLRILVEQGIFGTSFNRSLLAHYLAAMDIDGIKKTHFSKARYEYIYLSEQHAPALLDLKADAKQRAAKMGHWLNAMPPGASTSLPLHNDDEKLSGVYSVNTPSDSGRFIIYTDAQKIAHSPIARQWVFFPPQTPREVAEDRSSEFRLSVAFNFSYAS